MPSGSRTPRPSSSKVSVAARMLADLRGLDALIDRLAASAPATCAERHGSQTIVTAFGPMRTCIGYWRLSLHGSADGATLWEAMAAEQQERYRARSDP